MQSESKRGKIILPRFVFQGREVYEEKFYFKSEAGDKDGILEIPKSGKITAHIWRKSGYEAYVVGGCVRDSLLGRNPNDWDITTSAKPEQVKELFHRTVDTGLQHGTVTVLMEKEGYEVTTYRVDGEYEDGRHPKR